MRVMGAARRSVCSQGAPRGSLTRFVAVLRTSSWILRMKPPAGQTAPGVSSCVQMLSSVSRFGGDAMVRSVMMIVMMIVIMIVMMMVMTRTTAGMARTSPAPVPPSTAPRGSSSVTAGTAPTPPTSATARSSAGTGRTRGTVTTTSVSRTSSSVHLVPRGQNLSHHSVSQLTCDATR